MLVQKFRNGIQVGEKFSFLILWLDDVPLAGLLKSLNELRCKKKLLSTVPGMMFMFNGVSCCNYYLSY